MRNGGRRVGVYPGSFDPLTVAHLAVADAAVRALGLDRLDLALSVGALGKEHLDEGSLARRVAALERAGWSRPWLGVTVTTDRLVADVAAGYDAVVMGGDKWEQVRDPAWYGGDPDARDAALARLPRVAVAPRGGPLGGLPADAMVLPLPATLQAVSATAVRAGRADWAAELGVPGGDADGPPATDGRRA